MKAGVDREGEVLSVSPDGGADPVEGAAFTVSKDTVDPVVTDFPILETVAPVSGPGSDLVGIGVPVI